MALSRHGEYEVTPPAAGISGPVAMHPEFGSDQFGGHFGQELEIRKRPTWSSFRSGQVKKKSKQLKWKYGT